jgi:hypothetical protein
MNTRLFARLAWTGIASPLLMLLAYGMGGSKLGWLAAPLYAPGLMVAAAFVPGGVHSARADLYLQVAVVLNFVFIWILLLAVLRLFENFIHQRREHK